MGGGRGREETCHRLCHCWSSGQGFGVHDLRLPRLFGSDGCPDKKVGLDFMDINVFLELS